MGARAHYAYGRPQTQARGTLGLKYNETPAPLCTRSHAAAAKASPPSDWGTTMVSKGSHWGHRSRGGFPHAKPKLPAGPRAALSKTTKK